MRRFFIILSLIIFTTNSFADCDPGYTPLTPPTTNGSDYQYRAINGSTSSTSYTNNSDGDLSNGQWKVTWTSGNVTGTAKGEARVSSVSGTTGQPASSEPTASTWGQYCWCKITTWNKSAVTSSWVYYGQWSRNYCARYCAQSVSTDSTMRSGVFNSISSSICIKCSAKPENSEWTTECNYQCPGGRYMGTFTLPTGTSSGGYYSLEGTDYSVNYDNLSPGEWYRKWSGVGTVTGTSSCSSSYCYCRATQWKPASGAAISLSSTSVRVRDWSTEFACRLSCASSCSSTSSSTLSEGITTPACQSCPDGGTSNAGATEITQCYVPTTTDFTDAAGTYHYSSNCYYSK